jgi:hypothetical protein
MGAPEHDSRVRDFFRRVWNERDYAGRRPAVRRYVQ